MSAGKTTNSGDQAKVASVFKEKRTKERQLIKWDAQLRLANVYVIRKQLYIRDEYSKIFINRWRRRPRWATGSADGATSTEQADMQYVGR